LARTSIIIDDDAWEEFKRKAEKDGLKASYLIRKFIEAYNAGQISLGFNITQIKQGDGRATNATHDSE